MYNNNNGYETGRWDEGAWHSKNRCNMHKIELIL